MLAPYRWSINQKLPYPQHYGTIREYEVTKTVRIYGLIAILFSSGCTSISRMVTEASIEKKLREDGEYILSEPTRTGENVVTTFRLSKGEQKINYGYALIDENNNVVEENFFDARYRVSCMSDRCRISFSRRTDKMNILYRIKVNESGTPVSYSLGTIKKFKFVQD